MSRTPGEEPRGATTASAVTVGHAEDAVLDLDALDARTEHVDGAEEGVVVEPVDVVAQAVLAVNGVHSLHAGLTGSAATFLPGRRVAGISLRPEGTEVHVVVELGADVRATAQAVHAAVSDLGDLTPRPVHVHVEDLAAPGA